MAIILRIYAIGAALFGGWAWVESWDVRKVGFVLASGLLVTIAIEGKALMLGQWGYAEGMPVVFGLGYRRSCRFSSCHGLRSPVEL